MSALMEDDDARQDGGITPFELQAELDTLRSLRRRSISQPSDGIDPDLPPSPTSYSSSSSRDGTPPKSPTFNASSLSGSSSASISDVSPEQPVAGPSSGAGIGGRPRFPLSTLGEDLNEEAIDEDTALAGPGAFGDNGVSDLFWLPARLHPEIAPQEFRNFIKDQTKPENLMRRSGSMLGRKKSMLSRQYNPSDSDVDSSSESEGHGLRKTPSRAGSFRRSTGLERLTLNDLQQLEALARQAAEEGQEGKDGERKLKHLVRRSLSLNPAALLGAAADNDQLPSLMNEDEDIKPFVHDTDSPLIVPPPGSILRRSARTKIRKNSLVGDGNGHRFGPSRRSRGSPLGSERQDDEEGSETEGDRSMDMRKVSTSSQLSMLSLDPSEEHQGSLPFDDRDSPYRSPPASPEKAERHSISPERYVNQASPPSTTAPLPMQYMPSIPSSASSPPGAGNEQPVTLVGTVRTGADLPPTNKSPSPPAPRINSVSPPRAFSPDVALPSSGGNASQSLRTTRKPGQPPAQSVQGGSKVPTSSEGTSLPISPPFTAETSGSASSTTDLPSPGLNGRSDPPKLSQKLAQEVQKPMDAQNRKPLPPAASLVGRTVQQGSTFTLPVNHSVHTQQQSLNASLEQRRQREPPAIPSAPEPLKQASPAVTAPNTSAPMQPQPSKEKKSGWARLGLSRSNKEEVDTDDSSSIHSFSSTASSGKKGKKGKKDKELAPALLTEKRQAGPTQAVTLEKEKSESGGGFFGGLFGSKKKTEQADGNAVPAAGARNAQHMHMPTPPPTASGMLTADGRYINFFRLPIHIERAVYRLSHIKLANPRRPLYEQVLISNLMFWYLGVINKPAGQPSQQQQQRNAEAAARAQAAKQANNVNTEGFQQVSVAPIAASLPGSLPSDFQHTASPRPGLKREASSPPPPPPEIRQRAQSDVATRPDPAQMHPSSAAPAPTRPLSHPPKLAHSAPSAFPYQQASYNEFAGAPSPASNQFSTPNIVSPSSIAPSERDAPPPSRRLSDEAGFHVARPQRTASIQSTQGMPAQSPSASIQMRDKATGHIVGTADFEGRRRTTDLEALDIISAYADDEHRRSMGSSPDTYPAPATFSFASPTSPNGSAQLKVSSPPTSPPVHSTSQAYSQQSGSYYQHATHLASAPRSGPHSPPATT